jgi:hypothetical protein
MGNLMAIVPLADIALTEPHRGLALGRGLPNVPWTIAQRDRIYNVMLAGGQGSGKSSMLLRLAMDDIMSPNTATVVLDMKGSLSERLLRLVPPDVPKRWWSPGLNRWTIGNKRVWYLDLRRPAFGLTPLRVEPGWTHHGLADDFARIADAITRALLDLYPGQIMGSSEDLIERAVVGTMAIAWWEHEDRCHRAGRDATSDGFSGSFEVLSQMFAPSDRHESAGPAERGPRVVHPNRWHQAAGRACQKLPNLDQVADTLLYEIPRQARDNLGDIAKRMEAPANKLRPLVGAAASVRRFVGHPERLSLQTVIEAHDTLIINPRIELIGEDQASILTNFVVHMLDMQLKRQISVPREHRPRVSLIIDEAHRLVTETLITMAATHREAGLTVAAAVQYVSQLGADAQTPARREKILKGVGNLLQSKVLFRMSDSDDAGDHTQIFRSVYESMVRADPTSRTRMPFDPARLQTLRDHHALVSLVCSAGHTMPSGLATPGPGASRLPAFVTQTYEMPEVDDIPGGWRDVHLARQSETFTSYPEDMSALAVHDVPVGLGGRATGRAEPSPFTGVVPQLALSPPQATEPAPTVTEPVHPDGPAPIHELPSPSQDKAETAAPSNRPPAGRKTRKARGPVTPHPSVPGRPDDDRAALRLIGGVRVERSAPAEPIADGRATTDPSLEVLCQPTTRTMPEHALVPTHAVTGAALAEAGVFEGAGSLSEWELAGDEARDRARRASQRAQEQALAESVAAGLSDERAQHLAQERAQAAAASALEPHADAPWRTPVADLDLGDADAHTLEVIARLAFTAPRHLSALVEGRPSERAMRERLSRLFDADLLARCEGIIDGRRGRRPRIYVATPRGLEYLRLRHTQMRGDHETPNYLLPSRRLPQRLTRDAVLTELSTQLMIIGVQVNARGKLEAHWHTSRMPGGHWSVTMIHRGRRDDQLRLADLPPEPGMRVHGERLDIRTELAPALSIEVRGDLSGRRRKGDLLIEIDDERSRTNPADRLAAYDHFLGGWALRTRRFAADARGRPVVLYVATSPNRMMKLLRIADETLTLGFAPNGIYDPAEFLYPGRRHIAVCCLDWILGGQPLALRVPPLPPNLREPGVTLKPELVALLPEQWWPK